MSRTETSAISRIRLFDRLAAKVSKRARVRLGVFLLERGDEEGFGHLARAARRGSAEAQCQVGLCYLSARGTPQSFVQAAHWLELAAKQGHVAAQTRLAILSYEGFDAEVGPFSTADGAPNAEVALSWARRAAEAGDAEAQALVGHILSSDAAPIRDLDAAERWLRMSAAAGCPQGLLGFGLLQMRAAADDNDRREAADNISAAAQAGLPTAIFLLATFTADGYGVPKDLERAASLFEQAANANIVAAQTRWGVLLFEGRGTTRDLTMAEYWLRRAALAQNAEAATRLGALYTQGGEMPPNFMEAARWLEQAASQGRADAARMLGQLYLSGAGVPRSIAQATDWLQKAMIAGDELAGSELGNLVLAGEAGDFDQTALSNRFKVAAETGDPFAAYNYGVCLARGIGVAPDKRESIEWLGRAAEAIPDANRWIDEMMAEEDDAACYHTDTTAEDEAVTTLKNPVLELSRSQHVR